MKTRLLLSGLIFCGALASLAQNGYTTYTNNVSLTASAVRETAMLSDNQGNKWIGFKSLGQNQNAGLLKYSNGASTLYNTTSSPSIPSNSVQALAKDNAGNIWAGTTGGLVKINGSSFTVYTTSNGLPSNDIQSLDTYSGNVYVGTPGGLSIFDGSTFSNYNVGNGKLPFDAISAIEVENPNIIWLGGQSAMAELNITGGSSTFMNHPLPLVSDQVNCIYNDGAGTRWLGTTVSGVLMYNGGSYSNAKDAYAMYGTKIPDKVYSICEGLHGGVVIKGDVPAALPSQINLGNCALELAPNGQVYQYFPNTYATRAGDYIYKEGANLVISQGGPANPYNNGNRVIFYTLDPAQYSGFNHGVGVNNDNFKLLDINQVAAGITNRGDMHWDIGGNGAAMYRVPKSSQANANSATSLWISGYDNTNVLHTDAQTYRQNGSAFWPGPLDTVTVSSVNTAAQYDKVWKISYTDINDFSTNFANGNVQSGAYVPSQDFLTWPARGSGNVSRNLAPFVDVNNNGIYDPLVGGDYPKIKGDQTLYYIFNDSYSATTTAGCTPFGFEIQAMAYAYGCPSSLQGHPELAYTTFYDYKIINRSNSSYRDVSVALWTDVDLGHYGDDYIGTNVQGNYVYAYNADAFDDNTAGTIGYGSNIPAQGFVCLKGALAQIADNYDNDNDGIIDEFDEEALLNHSTYFNNGFSSSTPPATTDPMTCGEYNNYMTSKWKDGTPFTCGGNGYGGNTQFSANFIYPDASAPTGVCGLGWNEAAAGNVPGDRRVILSSSRLSFAPGEVKEIEYAFVTSFGNISGNPQASVAMLGTDVQNLRTFYAQTTKPTCYSSVVPVGISDMATEMLVSLYPNPATESVTVRVASGDVISSYELMDVLGKTVLSSNEKYNGQLNVPVTQLNRGVYFLKLNINSKYVVKKIIKD